MKRHIPATFVASIAAVIASTAGGGAGAGVMPPRIVFIQDGAIWTQNPFHRTRARVRNLPRGLVPAPAPAWSPDGKTIAYAVSRPERPGSRNGEGLPAIYLTGVAGGPTLRITDAAGGTWPAFSPDGQTLAYSNREGIWTVRRDGTRRRKLNVIGACPLWSPDGRKIAYCGSGPTSTTSSVWVVDADGAHPTRLTNTRSTDSPAGWSPDGQNILFTSDRGGSTDVWVMHADGSDQHALVKTPGAQEAGGWLPDGSILYVDWRGNHSRWFLRTESGSSTALPALTGRLSPLAWFAPATKPIAPKSPSAPAAPAPFEFRKSVRVGHATSMFIDCAGRGSPTVVFDAPLGASSETWLETQDRVAAVTRACRFDRPGLGLSSGTNEGRTAGEIVTLLHRLLHRSGTRAPYVLVGASFGGLDMRLYAARYTSEVTGLVLVDALPVGFDAEVEKLLSPDQRRSRRRQLAANDEHISFADILRSQAQVARAATTIQVPLGVIRHGLPFEGGPGFPSAAVERLWSKMQTATAALSASSFVVVARHAHHRIAEQQPELVSAVIRRVIRIVDRR